MSKRLNLSGTTIGTVTFLEELPDRDNGCIMYRARCLTCKREWVCRGAHTARHLRAGRSGCLQCYPKKAAEKHIENNETRRAEMIVAWLSGKTHDEIGDAFGITGERVRQIIIEGIPDAEVFQRVEGLPPAVLHAAIRKMRPEFARRLFLTALTEESKNPV